MCNKTPNSFSRPASPSARSSGFALGVEPLTQYNKPVAPATSIILSSKKLSAPVTKLNFTDLRKKIISLLEEYFSVRILDEALQYIEELRAPITCSSNLDAD